jgi:hypothetical protein
MTVKFGKIGMQSNNFRREEESSALRKFWLKAFDSCALKRKQTLNEVRFFTIPNSLLALIKG